MAEFAVEEEGVTAPDCCWAPPVIGAANWKLLGVTCDERGAWGRGGTPGGPVGCQASVAVPRDIGLDVARSPRAHSPRGQQQHAACACVVRAA